MLPLHLSSPGWRRSAAAIALLGCCGAASAQVVDAAVEIVVGPLSSISGAPAVELVEGSRAILPDETWQVVGTCANTPTQRIRVMTGVGALLGDHLRVRVTRAASVLIDRRVCITNADRLPEGVRRLLFAPR
jgi:hypothetical protein